jgi:hypothetical protein
VGGVEVARILRSLPRKVKPDIRETSGAAPIATGALNKSPEPAKLYELER